MSLWCWNQLFRFLFKYPPLVFQQGDFTCGLSRPVLLVVAAVAALARRARCSPIAASRRADRLRDRVVLVGLRLGGARACCSSACSGRRSILKAAVPQQNFLGVLVDDSRSMTIADRDGQPRSEFVQEQFGRPERAAARTRCRSGSSAVLPLLVVGRSRRSRRPT